MPFTLNDQQQSQPFSATPVPESDPLIVMSRAIMDDPLFRPYPPLDQERTGRLDKTLRQWAKQYRNEAIPGLLWVWAQDYDPNVGQIHRGVRPKLAREALIKLIGEDLGTDALAYWRLYLQRIEEENALRAAGG